MCADTRLKCNASCSPVHTTITSHCTVYSHSEQWCMGAACTNVYHTHLQSNTPHSTLLTPLYTNMHDVSGATSAAEQSSSGDYQGDYRGRKWILRTAIPMENYSKLRKRLLNALNFGLPSTAAITLPAAFKAALSHVLLRDSNRILFCSFLPAALATSI